MILSHTNILYSEVVETMDEKILDHIIQKFGEIVWEKYYEILSPNLVKNLVDNLKINHPALIEGVVLEKIPYSLLTEVMRKILMRGDSALYLPKMIEVMDCALYQEPGLSAEELTVRIVREIERRDNFWLVIHEREKHSGK